MGEVAVQYTVMPDPNIEIDIDSLVESISNLEQSTGTIQSMEAKPLAFGLQYLEIQVIIKDAEGQIDVFENALQSIGGVGEIEVMSMGRLL